MNRIVQIAIFVLIDALLRKFLEGREFLFDLLPSPGHQIVASPKALPCGRILPDDELRQLGILFADRRYGEVIFLFHLGCLLFRSDFNGRGWIRSGMHGYRPDDPYSDAAFLRKRKPSRPLALSLPVYWCMREAASQPQAVAGAR
jgi:hypothetical protein